MQSFFFYIGLVVYFQFVKVAEDCCIGDLSRKLEHGGTRAGRRGRAEATDIPVQL